MIIEIKKNKMLISIFETRVKMGEAVAEEVSETITDLLELQDEVNIIFGAAPSQNELLKGLVNNSKIQWNRINGFQMDEYIGLPQDASQRFGNFLFRQIFSQCSFKQVYYLVDEPIFDSSGAEADVQSKTDMNSDGKKPGRTVENSIQRYERLLEEHPADIVLLGIGENGHIAFNDPHVADFNDPLAVKEVTLDTKCRMQQVHDGCFQTLNEVPETALTLTIPSLMKAKYAFCTVPSPQKRKAVTAAVKGSVSLACPASILQEKAGARLFLDRESGADLISGVLHE